jgi:mediator of RNA polymerase II transcription subunit 6
MPDSLRSTSTSAKKPLSLSATNSTYASSRLLAESLDFTLRYADEYTDENPITGHPGDFHLSTTGRKGQQSNLKALPASKSASQSQSSLRATAPPTPEKVVLDTSVPSVSARKGSKSDKSPKTPGMPKPKRRKSKGLGSAGGISPA